MIRFNPIGSSLQRATNKLSGSLSRPRTGAGYATRLPGSPTGRVRASASRGGEAGRVFHVVAIPKRKRPLGSERPFDFEQTKQREHPLQ